MSAHELDTLLQAVLWIALIISSPLWGRIAYTLTLPIWTRLFAKKYLELTFRKGNKTYTVVVDPNTNYVLELEKRLGELGFNDAAQ